MRSGKKSYAKDELLIFVLLSVRNASLRAPLGLNRKLENRPLRGPRFLIICGSGGRLLSTLGPSEDAQKHRTATPTVILVIAASLCVPFSMLFTTVNVISDTFAAAMLRCTLLPTRCLSGGLPDAVAPRFKLLQPACRAGGAAQKGHFRVRHFAGFFDLTAESCSFHRAES